MPLPFPPAADGKGFFYFLNLTVLGAPFLSLKRLSRTGVQNCVCQPASASYSMIHNGIVAMQLSVVSTLIDEAYPASLLYRIAT